MSVQPARAAALLLAASISSGLGAAEPLPGPESLAGDPKRGRAVFLDRDLGHCLLCHQVAQLDEPFQGNIGTDLSDVGNRLDAAALRARITDPTLQNPETVMPAYHRTHDLVQVAAAYRGKPILDGQQLEDLIAFLKTLKLEEPSRNP